MKKCGNQTAATAIRFLTFMQRMEARGSFVRQHVLFKEFGLDPAVNNIPTPPPAARPEEAAPPKCPICLDTGRDPNAGPCSCSENIPTGIRPLTQKELDDLPF